MPLSDFYGEIHECPHCKVAKNAADIPERSCTLCFGRFFVADCMGCDAKGFVEEPVAGAAAGTMKATCNKCGGKGVFAVNKPADWKPPVEETKKLEATTA